MPKFIVKSKSTKEEKKHYFFIGEYYDYDKEGSVIASHTKELCNDLHLTAKEAEDTLTSFIDEEKIKISDRNTPNDEIYSRLEYGYYEDDETIFVECWDYNRLTGEISREWE